MQAANRKPGLRDRSFFFIVLSSLTQQALDGFCEQQGPLWPSMFSCCLALHHVA
jgi:hypothetical protein